MDNITIKAAEGKWLTQAEEPSGERVFAVELVMPSDADTSKWKEVDNDFKTEWEEKWKEEHPDNLTPNLINEALL